MLKNMRVTMLLADHAVVAEGKLYVNGGGWSIRPAAPTPMYLALKFDVPWDLAGHPIELELRLDGYVSKRIRLQGMENQEPPVVKLEPVKSEPTGKGKGKTKTSRRKSKK